MDGQVTVVAEDVQVVAKARRRTYTADYKRRVLKEADGCTTPGAVGALLRREGLYSSHLAEASADSQLIATSARRQRAPSRFRVARQTERDI